MISNNLSTEERLKALMQSHRQEQKKQLEEYLALVLRNLWITKMPEIQAELTDWQLQVMEARQGVLQEVEGQIEHHGSFTAAAKHFERSAKSGKLSDDVKKMVQIANVKGNKEARGASFESLKRWRKFAKQGAEFLAPVAERKASLPEWVPPLFNLLQRADCLSIEAAVRALRKDGFRCTSKTVKRFITSLAERIKKESK